MRIPHTICGFRLQLRNPQELNLTLQMSYSLFVDSYFAYFWSDFEQHSVLGICLWNPKQRRRSKKNSKVSESAANLILVCCGIRLQCTECTV